MIYLIVLFLASTVLASAQTQSPSSTAGGASTLQVAQSSGGPPAEGREAVNSVLQDPSWLIGATLQSVITQFGSPLSVRPVRGTEVWQDDVVFSYDGIDIYWYKDRVWQVAVPQGFGIQLGYTRDQVFAVLGEPLLSEDPVVVYRLPSRGWPLRLQIRFGEKGLVEGLYVYRPDM
ncbi:MAG: hypothetical protein SNJ56_01900 [Termitinemataceae bacterium]